MIASDGHVKNDNKSVMISQSNDIGLKRIKYILNLINGNHKIYVNKNAYSISLYSEELVQILSKYNIINNKTLLFDINDSYDINLFKYFIQGYIEGDGCITLSSNGKGLKYLNISVVGTKNFINHIYKIIDIKSSIFEIKKCKNLYSIAWNGKYADEFVNKIYDDVVFKEGKYQNILNWKENYLMDYQKYANIKSNIQKYINDNLNVTAIQLSNIFNIPFQTIYKWKSNNEINFKYQEYPNCGETGGSSKLKEKDVIEILNKLKKNINYKDLSKEYDISTSQIYKIKNKQSWNYLYDKYPNLYE